MVSSSSLRAVLSLASLLSPTVAWPFGAGSCPLRQPAVGGSHLTQSKITRGTLEQGGLTLTLDGVVLSAGTPANFTAGKNHVLTLTATIGNTFNGILFRLGGSVDTTAALQVPSGESQLQIARTVCVQQQGVGGVTHSVAQDWTSKKIILRLDEDAADLPLDVTVVGVNDATEGSIWHYSAYTLNAIGGKVSTSSTSSSSSSSSSTNSSSSSSTSSLRGNSTSSNSVQSTGTGSTSSSSHVSKIFIISTALLGIISLISFGTMLSTFGYRLRKQPS